MKMVLISYAGVSSLVKFGDADAATYWIDRIVEKGGVPEIKLVTL